MQEGKKKLRKLKKSKTTFQRVTLKQEQDAIKNRNILRTKRASWKLKAEILKI